MPDRAAEDAAQGRRRTALHDRAPAGLLQRHQPDRGRARPRRRPRPRRRRGPGSRDAARRWGRPSPSTYAAPRPPARSPATSSPSTSPNATRTRRTQGGRASERTDETTTPQQAEPSRGRWCSTCTSPRPRSPAPAPASSWPGWRTSARWSPPTRSGLVRQPRRAGGGQAGDRPQRAHPRRGLRGPRPAARADRRCATTPACSPGAPDQPARRDADHVIPYAEGGTTCSDNIAPLVDVTIGSRPIRAWTYTMLEPGSFLWSSPHGYQFLRDHHGTLDVSRDRRPPEAHPPDAVAARPTVVPAAFRRTEPGLV